MQNEIYSERRERLRQKMHVAGLDALLISHAPNRFYLSGFELHDPQFNESAGRLIITADGQDWLCTDPRYLDAAKRLWDEERIFIYKKNAATEIGKLLKKEVGGRIGVEKSIISAEFYAQLGKEVSLSSAQNLVESLRIIKDQHEILLMQKSCELNHRLMEWVYTELHIGRSEADLAWGIEKFFRERGASELAFSSIVAVGPNAALPHAIPGETKIVDNSPVLIDVGCRLADYCSDQTRTFWVGSSDTPNYFMLTQQLVRTAQEAALAEIRPGQKCSDIYQCARQVFVDEGVEEAFTHGLGHGVGLETHEAPSLNPRCHTILKPGMVVTVEPGLYYPDWGGVRREFMALVTEDGCKIL